MGEVYRARDTRLEREVAAKVLPAHTSSPQAFERFEREAKAIAARWTSARSSIPGWPGPTRSPRRTQGIVHRDLKPVNIVLTPRRPKIREITIDVRPGPKSPHYGDGMALFKDFACKSEWLTPIELDQHLESSKQLNY